MESINPQSLDFADHGVTPVIGRPKPLPPEINKAIRHEKRAAKLTDFSRKADHLLSNDSGHITEDSEEIMQIHKLMARISGSDLIARNEMAAIINSKLKRRGDRLRVCKVKIPSQTIQPGSFRAYIKSHNRLQSIRENMVTMLDHCNRDKPNISIANSGHYISRKALLSLVSHCLESQIMSGVISGEIASLYAKRIITSETRIRNSNFIELFLDPEANTELERPTYKIVVPRLLSPITEKVTKQLKQDLSASNSGMLDDQHLSLESYIEKAYNLPEFLDVLSSVLRDAGIERPTTVSSALDAVGQELLSISALRLPHYLIETYTGKHIYTPLRSSDELAFITHMRILRNEKGVSGYRNKLGIAPDHELPIEGLPVNEFKGMCIGFLQAAHHKNSRGGTDKFGYIRNSQRTITTFELSI